jgi:hypothetical protein
MKTIFAFTLCLIIGCKQSGSQKETEQEYYPTNTNELEDNIRTLELQNIDWSCQCADWATEADIKLYQDTGKLSEHTVFIEPEFESLQLSDTLGYNGDIIKFVGRFYKDVGYPKKYPITEMQVDKAKVFRYSSYQVIRSNYRDFKLENK